jgi:hypothetical protein
MSDKALVFISCGQFSPEEKQLGTAVCNLVDSIPGLEGYFADQQSSPEGLSKHIFGALERAAGFIAVMHPRGEVTLGGTHTRASVWIEQEIAIVSYIQATRGEGGPKVAAYARKGIHREGVRDTIILNPKEFETNDDVLEDLKKKLTVWKLKPWLSKEAKVSIDLGYTKTNHGDGELHTYETKIVMKNEGAGDCHGFVGAHAHQRCRPPVRRRAFAELHCARPTDGWPGGCRQRRHRDRGTCLLTRAAGAPTPPRRLLRLARLRIRGRNAVRRRGGWG